MSYSNLFVPLRPVGDGMGQPGKDAVGHRIVIPSLAVCLPDAAMSPGAPAPGDAAFVLLAYAGTAGFPGY